MKWSAAPRYPYAGKILCQDLTLQKDNIWLLGASQDLSKGGVGFILHRRFDPGTPLTIQLERLRRDTWGLLPARVLHATSQADGNWKLGCALINAMSPEELHGWINGEGSKVAPFR